MLRPPIRRVMNLMRCLNATSALGATAILTVSPDRSSPRTYAQRRDLPRSSPRSPLYPDLVAQACHPLVGAGLSASASRTAGSTARRYVVVPHATRARGEQNQTRRPHTTHLEGYPSAVTVVRARHPLEGQALPLLGWMRRHGKLDLILVLPDGSRSLIPAAWTDLDPSAPGEAATLATLGSIADLLHAGRVLAGIIQSDSVRPDDGHISNLEGAHAQPAVGAGPRRDAGARTAPLGPVPSRAPVRRRGGPGPIDRPGRRSRGGPA